MLGIAVAVAREWRRIAIRDMRSELTWSTCLHLALDPNNSCLARSIEILRQAHLLKQLPLSSATGGVADAVRLPDGRILVAVREIGLTGLTNKLAWLARTRGGYRLRNFATLPLGAFDNVEGLAQPRGSCTFKTAFLM